MPSSHPVQDDIFYQAYLRRDSRFEGIFFLAVKSTGIFCRPGCAARTPKRENVVFYRSAQQAMDQGFRPCKKCKPLQALAERPSWVIEALALLEKSPQARVSDDQLKQQGIDPVNLRRWFKRRHGVTFHEFQRDWRIGKAASRISKGDKVIDSAFGAGFESLSGFHQAFKSVTGASPRASSNKQALQVEQLNTPLGPMYAAASEDALCLLEFTDRKALPRQIERVQRRLNAYFVPASNALLVRVQTQLDEYFAGKRRQFDLPLRLEGTGFQQQAWFALRDIPYGETLTYLEQATALGKPQSVLAVASANAANPLAIVVPCHRVIAKNGALAGYAGGVWRKQYLIDLESSASGFRLEHSESA